MQKTVETINETKMFTRKRQNDGKRKIKFCVNSLLGIFGIYMYCNCYHVYIEQPHTHTHICA